MLRSFLLLFIFLLAVFPAKTHDYHTSLTDIRYNPKSRTLEVAVKLFANDLEKALSAKHKTSIILGKSEKTEAYVAGYVKEKLVLKSGKGEVIALKYVGREVENDVVWLYLESAEVALPDLKKLTVQNSLLTEIFNDQMNIVTLQVPGKKSSFLFNGEVERHQFE